MMPFSIYSAWFSSFSGDEYDSVARQAYQALLFLSVYKPSDKRYQAFSENVTRRSKTDFGYTYAPTEKVGFYIIDINKGRV